MTSVQSAPDVSALALYTGCNVAVSCGRCATAVKRIAVAEFGLQAMQWSLLRGYADGTSPCRIGSVPRGSSEAIADLGRIMLPGARCLGRCGPATLAVGFIQRNCASGPRGPYAKYEASRDVHHPAGRSIVGQVVGNGRARQHLWGTRKIVSEVVFSGAGLSSDLVQYLKHLESIDASMAAILKANLVLLESAATEENRKNIRPLFNRMVKDALNKLEAQASAGQADPTKDSKPSGHQTTIASTAPVATSTRRFFLSQTLLCLSRRVLLFLRH